MNRHGSCPNNAGGNLNPTPFITIPTIEDLTRRQFMSSALAAALLIACSDEDKPNVATTAARSVKDAYGNSIEVPVAAQRVVAADNGTLPWLLELGVVPVAAGSVGTTPNGGTDFPQALYALGANKVKPFNR